MLINFIWRGKLENITQQKKNHIDYFCILVLTTFKGKNKKEIKGSRQLKQKTEALWYVVLNRRCTGISRGSTSNIPSTILVRGTSMRRL